jgi:uncharacterized membrane protein
MPVFVLITSIIILLLCILWISYAVLYLYKAKEDDPDILLCLVSLAPTIVLLILSIAGIYSVIMGKII